jgi:putative transposase
MPRIPRASIGGHCCHVLNRGNGRQEVFHKDDDYDAFLKAIAHGCIEVPMPVLGYCLMPNHFHLVVQPAAEGDLSRWMHWLQNTHVRRYHQHYHSSGHVWQGRFKSFPIQEDDHLLTVLQYAERNPVRAKLVRSAERWRWSSARAWAKPSERPAWLADGPVPKPVNWLERVNAALTPAELESLRRSVNRGTPFGGEAWVRSTAKMAGLESTLRSRGRPKKEKAEGKANNGA